MDFPWFCLISVYDQRFEKIVHHLRHYNTYPIIIHKVQNEISLIGYIHFILFYYNRSIHLVFSLVLLPLLSKLFF